MALHRPSLQHIVSPRPKTRTQRITCSAWSPALANGRAYTCATAAGEELALWTVDPFTGMVSGQKVRPQPQRARWGHESKENQRHTGMQDSTSGGES